ncbi:BLOC-1-related complex subunit 6-like [Homarus americanus]|uniref:BLOC-1-related complex subunit 6-like n=1 Tax=Homarus americanus TaxID=6706 RepID=A0A8J5N7R5_HOMAM|nr:BLOC-1-related complex subunit 6-like [Homarus americanus]
MGEEYERKRISTNPFLYTDGSLVEEDVLQAGLEPTEGSTEGSITSTITGSQELLGDPDQTPQAEIPSRQVWVMGRAAVSMSIDIDDEKLQTMTGSYSEILERPMLGQRIAEEDEQVEEGDNDMARDDMDAVTPVCSNVDPVQAFLTQERLTAFMAHDDSQGEAPEYGAELSCDNQAESALQGAGIVTRQGDIISFVADDLHNKIKLSSPVSKTVASFPGSRSSTPSLLRTALAPQVPPIDPSIINDIETHARHIATSVDTLIENLTGTLLSISALTVDCVETYRDAVCKTCDAVDANIKMVEILTQDIHALRTQNWHEFISSLKLMLPWMTIYDNDKYGQYLPDFSAVLDNLQGEQAEYMENGLFAQFMTGKPYSFMWLESTMNKGSKLESDWLVILNHEKPLLSNTPNIKNVNRVRASVHHHANPNKNADMKHADSAMSKIKIEEKANADLSACLTEFKCDPFGHTNQTVRSLQSGIPASEMIAAD